MRQLRSGDSVFKYKRLPIEEANYDILMDEKVTPKVRRSEKAQKIFDDRHNLTTLTSNRQKLKIRS